MATWMVSQLGAVTSQLGFATSWQARGTSVCRVFTKRVTRGLNIGKYANSSGIGRITADAKRANNMTTRKRKGTRKREQEERKKTSSKRISLCVSICLTIRRSGELPAYRCSERDAAVAATTGHCLQIPYNKLKRTRINKQKKSAITKTKNIIETSKEY